MKVVLSHPYSGALRWWLANQTHQGLSKQPELQYYRQLYGDVDRNLDLALACSVVFEEIVLPAADDAQPQFEPAGISGARQEALGIETDWEPVREATRLIESLEHDLLDDDVIDGLMAGLPEHARKMELMYAAADVLLTTFHDAPIICAPSRFELVRRLIDLSAVPIDRTDAAIAVGTMAEPLEQYAELVSLRLTSDSIEKLADVKRNDKIRRYAGSFQDVLSRAAGDSDRLFQDVAAAWDSAELAEEIAGASSAFSRVMAPAGLIPGVGTLTTVAGIGADVGAGLASRRSDQLRWYTIGPEIQRFESLRDLDADLRLRGLR